MSEDYMNPRFLERVSKVGTASGMLSSVEKVAIVCESYGRTLAMGMECWHGRGFLPTGPGVRLQLPMHGDWICTDVEVYASFGELRHWSDVDDETQRLPEWLSLAEAVARGLGIQRPRMGHFRFKERRTQAA